MVAVFHVYLLVIMLNTAVFFHIAYQILYNVRRLRVNYLLKLYAVVRKTSEKLDFIYG